MRTKRAWILVVAMTVAGAACSTSGGGDAASPTTTSRPSRVTTTSSAKTTSTVDETTSTTDAATSTTEASGTGAAGTACDLVAPADLTAAGIDGTITETGDETKNFSVGSSIPSTACGYSVEQGNVSAGITILMADGVATGAIDDATDFAKAPEEVTGLGDRAIYDTEPADPPFSAENAMYAQQGGRLVVVNSVDATVTPKEALVALARTLLAA